MPSRQIPKERLERVLFGNEGLTTEEVIKRREKFGSNNIVDRPRRLLWDVLRDTSQDPMLWFLLVVSVAFFSTGAYVEAVILLIALVPLICMDVYLHWRSQISTQGLASRLASYANVLRDGKISRVNAQELVPGDFVYLTSGDAIPADGLFSSAADVQVDESTLTGESYPVRKRPLPNTAFNQPNVDFIHWGFAGTRLLTGQANLRIACIGAETIYGGIVRSAYSGRHTQTPLQKAIKRLVAIIVGVALILCIGLGAIRLLQGHGVLDAILSALTLAVAALPEEYPIVFTAFLGVGIYRLAQRQALVRRAVAVENIGRVSVICSDKTGTLTEGRLTLAHLIPAEGIADTHLLDIAALAARNDSGDPLDDAILCAGAQDGQVERLASFPFTEARRRETAIWMMQNNELIAVVKGAPETVLKMCFDRPAQQSKYIEQINKYASTGHKVIACASRGLDKVTNEEPDHGYAFMGLLAFEDKLREGAKEAIADCQAAGIRVIMITGDHPATSQAIAVELGLGTTRPNLITGDILEIAFKENSYEKLAPVDVIARATPSQKVDVVRVLKSQGEIVAVTGDGVNDVPALKLADVGIAMGERGTASAREAASIVLLDDNFRTIVMAIGEAQQLFKNLRLSFAYILLVHIPLVLSAAFIPLMGYPLLYLPIHIVWLELIIHPTALLVFQEYPAVRLIHKENEEAVNFYSTRGWTVIAGVGLLVTAALYVSFTQEIKIGKEIEYARSVALIILISASATITAVLSRLRTWTAIIMIMGSVGSLIILVQLSTVAKFMHLQPVSVSDWVYAGVSGIAAGLITKFLDTIKEKGSRGHGFDGTVRSRRQ